jgi:hypothetical protein
MSRVIVRSKNAGVHFGELVSRSGMEVHLRNARRLWYWDGAASLSELAERGTSAPQNCKFPIPMKSVILTEAIEIIEVSEAAAKSIDEVPVWTRH